jgi:Holliday junction DNA helicase RuvB
LKQDRTENDDGMDLCLCRIERGRGLYAVGQKDIIDNLKICLTAAKQRKEPLEHILLSGPPGLGKTSLAHVISHEMNAKITVTSGPAIERAGDLIGILTNLEKMQLEKKYMLISFLLCPEKMLIFYSKHKVVRQIFIL